MSEQDFQRELINLQIPLDDNGNPEWIPLSLRPERDEFDPKGFYPPYGVSVALKLVGEDCVYQGETGQLTGAVWPARPHRTVFIYWYFNEVRVAFAHEVSHWTLTRARPSLLHHVS